MGSEVSVTDKANEVVLQGASVNAAVYDIHGRVVWTGNDVTGSKGKVRFTYKLVFDAQMGTCEITCNASLNGFELGSGQKTFFSLG